MTREPPREARGGNHRHLALAEDGPGSFARHPGDGWQLAAPYPLGRRALRALHALIAALCPAGAAPRSRELDARVERSARVFLAYMHPVVARALAVGLVVLDFLPLVLLRRAPLHRLGRSETSELVARFAKSRFLALRLLVVGVRSLVLSVYFDQSEVHRAIGYAPEPFLRERVALRRKLVNPLLPVAAE